MGFELPRESDFPSFSPPRLSAGIFPEQFGALYHDALQMFANGLSLGYGANLQVESSRQLTLLGTQCLIELLG